ncbi:MAG: exodeoxyribonuclease III [Nitratireductor sp.]
MTFKLITWNINSVRLRMPLIQKLVEMHDPDIICFQEIKCQNDQFPTKAFEELGYVHQAVHGQKGYHGVATVSKTPLTNTHSTDYVNMGDTRHISTNFEVGGKTMNVHNFYVPAGGDEPNIEINPKFDHKLKFIEQMKELNAVEKNIPSILVGDLNIAPLEEDVWSHKQLLKVVSHTPVEVEGLTHLMEGGDWKDLIRQHIPVPEKVFTWWSYRSKDWKVNNRGRRLDHVWAADEIAQKLTNIEIVSEARDWEKCSDHVPVIASFNFD